MKIYDYGFIGSGDSNLTFDLSGEDNQFLYDENVLKMPNAKKKILTHYLVQNMIKCPIVYFGLSKVIPFNDDTIIKPIIDYGRNCSHSGILSHQSFSDTI